VCVVLTISNFWHGREGCDHLITGTAYPFNLQHTLYYISLADKRRHLLKTRVTPVDQTNNCAYFWSLSLPENVSDVEPITVTLLKVVMNFWNIISFYKNKI
jgi:hypothetical protein